jgi:hypothetical protein
VGRSRRRGRVHRALERRHELGAPEHPLIALVGLPAPAEGLDRGPAAETADEPELGQNRRWPARARGTVPRRALWPVQG